MKKTNEMKKVGIVIVITLFLMLFFVNGAFALTISSPSYSVGAISSGVQASNPESSNYNGAKDYLTVEATGNAQGSVYQGVVGYYGKYGAVKQSENSLSIVIKGTKLLEVGKTYSIDIEIKDNTGNYMDSSSAPKISLYDSSNNVVVDNVEVTKVSTGKYEYIFETSSSHPVGNWKTIISITNNGVTKQYSDIWQLVNYQTEGVTISSTKTVIAGNVYSMNLEIKDSSGNYVDSSSAPKISLYDSLANLVVNNVSVTRMSTGKYQYNFTTSLSYTGGEWKAIISITNNGVTKQYSDIWQLVNSPTEVKIVGISDTTIPTITANVEITNEGNVDYEYTYEYCVVSSDSNQCGGTDDVAYGTGSKKINVGQTWNTQLSLNVNSVGTYLFKVIVHYNSYKSGAAKSFVAIEQSSGGGSGGGGGGSSSSSGGGSGGGGGGGSSVVGRAEPVIEVSSSEFEKGVTSKVSLNQEIKFDLQSSASSKSELHSVKVSKIEGNNATIIISSNPVIINLLVGGERKVDIDNDKIYDIYIKLNSILDGKVDITIQEGVGKIYRSKLTGSAITSLVTFKTDQLFDINLVIPTEFLIVKPGETVFSEVKLYNMGTEGIVDALLKYEIRDSDGRLIKSRESTVAVYTSLQLLEKFVIPDDAKEGKYNLKAEVLYGNQSARAQTQFTIYSENSVPSLFEKISEYSPFISLLLLVLIIIIVWKIIGNRYNLLKLISFMDNGKRIRDSQRLVNQKEYVHGANEQFNRAQLGSNRDVSKKSDTNRRLSELYGLKVISTGGHFIGSVKEVYVHENKIYGLMVKIDRKIKTHLKHRNILIKQKDVISIGDAVIVNDKVLSLIDKGHGSAD